MADDDTLFQELAEHLELPKQTTRRGFLKFTLGSTVAVPFYTAWAYAASPPIIILENSEGLVVADSTRCVGCRRCELACTEFNDGRAQPSMSRIKVSRNYNFGPRGQQAGFYRGMGDYGNFRMVQDTCRQCPHPVPCATACPNDAIIADPKTNARRVDPDRCTGCHICQRACPWEMMSFDDVADKATKCFLCDGNPECVQVCSTGALRYVPWRDMSRAVPIRQATLPVTKDYKTGGCSTCHAIPQ
jgi:Fe-S-cluster-containing dehydrogenase component